MKKISRNRTKRTKKKPTGLSQRNVSAITKPKTNRLLTKSEKFRLATRRRRRSFINADRRRFTPVLATEEQYSSGRPARITARDVAHKSEVSLPRHERDKTIYQRSKDVSVCKRRKKRREILFKLQKAGKGRPGPRKRKLNVTSEIRCK